jgi:hypothetical protein
MSSSTFVGVDIERHGIGYECATCDESSDLAVDVESIVDLDMDLRVRSSS